MRIFLLLVLIVVSCNLLHGQSFLENRIENAFHQGDSLTQLISYLERKYPIRFYYLNDWLDKVTLKDIDSGYTLQKVFYDALVGTNISYVEPNPHTIIFVKDPTLALQRLDFLTLAKRNQGKIKKLVIGNPDKSTSFGIISGKIMDAKTKDVLAGVSILTSNDGVGTTTDANGYFRLRLSVGNHVLNCRYVNFDQLFFDVTLHSNGEVVWYMEELPTVLDELVIQDQSTQNITTTTIGVTQLNLKEIKRAPALLGEVDLIKAIQLTPGVTTVGEAASGFNVRGGSVDQNLIQYDGVPIFNSSHLFGFFSSFNSEAIRDVTFYRGGISPEFGGRISSILDIRSKEGDYETWHGHGGIGMISTNAMIDGPLKKDKTSIALSSRFTYSNWLINTVRSDLPYLNKSTVSFYDASMKLSHKFSEKSKFTLSGYTSHDSFQLRGDSTYEWSTQALSARWDYTLRDHITGATHIGYGRYYYNVYDKNPTSGFILDYELLYPNAKTDLYFKFGRHKILSGLQATYYNFKPGSLKPYSASSATVPQTIETQYSLESALYLEDQFNLSPKVHVNIGLRYSVFHSFGPGPIAQYKPNRPRETISTVDTLHFAKGEVIKGFNNPEPRLSMRYEISPSISLKLGYDRMVQYLHLITNTTAITPVDIWQSSGYYFKPQTADQFSFGYFQNIKDKKYQASAELYYKEIDHVIDFKDGAELILNPQLETDLLQGKSRAYGVETQLAKSKGRLESTFSYTYSRSLRTITGIYEDESINEGREYPSNFDQPHIVNINWRYNISKRYFFTGAFTYRTGRPITLPVVAFPIENYTVSSFSDRNLYRIPDYHRLDVGLVIEGSHKRKKFWDGTWTISVYNAYARKNPYSIFFKEVRPGILRAYQLAVIGVALPSITYSFKI